MAMNIIPDSIRDVLDYNPETGEFVRKVHRGRYYAGQKAGCIDKKGYVVIRYNGRGYFAHRLAYFFVHGEQPYIIDHINHQTADNRIANLRNVDRVINGLNQKKTVGVFWKINPQNGIGYWRSAYRSKYLYSGKSILLAYFHRIMAEREDHPIALPSPSSAG